MSQSTPNNGGQSPLRGLIHHLDKEEAYLIEVRQFLNELLRAGDLVAAIPKLTPRIRGLTVKSHEQGDERHRVLSHLAQGLGCRPQEVTLRDLTNRLPSELVEPLIAARSRLLRVAAHIRQQLSTLQWMHSQTRWIVATVLEALTGTSSLQGYNAAGREIPPVPLGGTLSRA